MQKALKHFTAIAAILVSVAPSVASAHGFNANWVDIMRTPYGRYRVIIKYTHNEVGEYREAIAEFDDKDEAIKVFQDLAKGADFFLGDVKKSIHFHNPPLKNKPY